LGWADIWVIFPPIIIIIPKLLIIQFIFGKKKCDNLPNFGHPNTIPTCLTLCSPLAECWSRKSLYFSPNDRAEDTGPQKNTQPLATNAFYLFILFDRFSTSLKRERIKNKLLQDKALFPQSKQRIGPIGPMRGRAMRCF
jgi:hypothetical protein